MNTNRLSLENLITSFMEWAAELELDVPGLLDADIVKQVAEVKADFKFLLNYLERYEEAASILEQKLPLYHNPAKYKDTPETVIEQFGMRPHNVVYLRWMQEWIDEMPEHARRLQRAFGPDAEFTRLDMKDALVIPASIEMTWFCRQMESIGAIINIGKKLDHRTGGRPLWYKLGELGDNCPECEYHGKPSCSIHGDYDQFGNKREA